MFQDIFANLKQQNNNASVTKQMAVIVEGYDISSSNLDDHFVYGKDYITGEDVKVFLEQSRVNKAKGNSKFAPPSISVFYQGDINSNKLDNRIVKEGGIILFHKVYEKNGMYSARWAEAINHNNVEEDKQSKASERIALLHGLTNLTFGLKKTNNEPYFFARTFLATDSYYQHIPDLIKPLFEYKKGCAICAKSFEKADHLKKYCEILFAKRNFGFVLRANGENEPVGTINIVPPSAGEINQSGKELVEKHLANPIANIESAMQEGHLKNVEVIPYIQVWGGSFTKELVAKELISQEKTWLRRSRPLYQEIDEYGNYKNVDLWTNSFLKISVMGDKFGNIYNEDKSLKGITYSGKAMPQEDSNSYCGILNAGFFVSTETNPDYEKTLTEKVENEQPTTKLYLTRNEIYKLLGYNVTEEAENQAIEQTNPYNEQMSQAQSATEYAQTEHQEASQAQEESYDDWDDDIPF